MFFVTSTVNHSFVNGYLSIETIVLSWKANVCTVVLKIVS